MLRVLCIESTREGGTYEENITRDFCTNCTNDMSGNKVPMPAIKNMEMPQRDIPHDNFSGNRSNSYTNSETLSLFQRERFVIPVISPLFIVISP